MPENGVPVARTVLLTFALVLSVALAPGGAPAEATASEQEVKSAFLLNFARLVEWPEGAFSDARSPLTIGILGSSSSSERIGKFLDGKFVGSRKVRTRRIESVEQAADFHMVFVGESSGTGASEVAGATNGGPVLLVGESNGFAENGGAINFFTDGNKIRFEVNPKAAEAAGLRVSSRLLRVAKIVSDG
jgi:hypothetical protein